MVSVLSLQFMLLSLVALAWSQNATVSVCGKSMCVGASKDVTTGMTDYVMRTKGGLYPGWMAIGFGTAMRGTPMVVMWTNDDGSVTLSQRKGSGNIEPAVDSAPSGVASVLADLTSANRDDGEVQFAFSMPSSSKDRLDVIFALGDKNPGSAAEDASLQYHTEHGSGSLRLSAAKSGPLLPDSASDVQPLRSYERIILAHAICCVLGYLVLLPAGALMARFLRTFSAKWFVGHWIVQFAVAGPLILAGVSLGFHSVNERGGIHALTAHKKLGIALFVLYFAQCGLGALIHWVKPKNFKGRPPQNYIHAILGIAIIGMALYQVRIGFTDEWTSVTGRDIDPAANIIWYIWVVMLPLLYAVGLALLPRQFRQEHASKETLMPRNDLNESGFPNRYRY